MNLSRQDYVLALVGQRLAPLLRQFGEFESDLVRRRLRTTNIEQPVFIAGLARSGTTILLNLLSQCRGVATHRYRDFPFLWTPMTWNWFQDHIARTQPAVERPHRDRIRITKESPEAFEEPVWQYFFPWIHDPQNLHVLDSSTDSPEFEAFFCDFIRKILLIRGGERYVSKGNYNISRLAYLARLFPDARFLIPVRAPLAHVHSLVKQHQLFTGYAAQDRRVVNYLRAAGHYEFGPQRQPINFSRAGAERILSAWRAGDNYQGYATLWSEIYAHVEHITSADSALAEQILVVRYETFCANPRETLNRILDFTRLTERGSHLLDNLGEISAPPDETTHLPKAVRSVVRAETEHVAARFGYVE